VKLSVRAAASKLWSRFSGGSSARRMSRATLGEAGGLTFLERMQQIPIHRLMAVKGASIFSSITHVKGRQ
jgi:hypothetical protein